VIVSIVTRLIGDKRAWRAHRARIAALPAGHRQTVDAIERYLLVFGPSSGPRVQRMFDDLADLFEQSAADGTAVRDVVGADPVEFAEAFLRNYADDGWVAEERGRLVRALERAEAPAGGVTPRP
jgi:DNA-binding ferritin-like protein (Dps family)